MRPKLIRSWLSERDEENRLVIVQSVEFQLVCNSVHLHTSCSSLVLVHWDFHTPPLLAHYFPSTLVP